MSDTRWTEGDRVLGAAVDAALVTSGVRVLRDDDRRRVVALRAGGRPVLVKQFRAGSGRHRRRESWKARLGRAPAEREWRALGALHGAGLPVPAPLALGTLPGGDRLLVMAWLPGLPFRHALRGPPGERRALLRHLGSTLARLHETGWVHGDLHPGNLLIGPEGPVLLDWQHARRSGRRAARRADLAHLEYGLAARFATSDRVRLRAAALGLAPPFDRAAREELRRAGRAVEDHARRHARGRTRRLLRPGRGAEPAAWRDARGLRLPDLGAATLCALLDSHDEAIAAADARVLECDARSRVTGVQADGRRAVVKEVGWRGLARGLADALRGSVGRRAWRGGHGLRARRVGAALPLACADRRRFGVPVRSWVVLEDLRPAPEAAFALDAALGADEVLDALVRLLVALHGAGADHRDPKGTNVRLVRAGGRLEGRFLDLEDVRFPRRLSDARRLDALAALNASLPDAIPAAPRLGAFARYARALPFRMGADAALEQVVAASLARRHRWTGAGCGPAGAPALTPPARG
jgi:tRNA A-37 threonylcarbamoyl transferase component Bud32